MRLNGIQRFIPMEALNPNAKKASCSLHAGQQAQMICVFLWLHKQHKRDISKQFLVAFKDYLT